METSGGEAPAPDRLLMQDDEVHVNFEWPVTLYDRLSAVVAVTEVDRTSRKELGAAVISAALTQLDGETADSIVRSYRLREITDERDKRVTQVGFDWPVTIKNYLDTAVVAYHDWGGRTSRTELAAAIIFAALPQLNKDSAVTVIEKYRKRKISELMRD